MTQRLCAPSSERHPAHVTPITRRVVRCTVLDDDRDLVTITHPEGEVELAIVLTRDGPVLRVSAAHLQLEARTVDVRATHGSIRLEANDFVELDGERIKLNC